MTTNHSTPEKLRILIDAHAIGGEYQGSVSYLKGLYQAMIEKYSEHYDFYFAGYNYEAMRACFPQVKAENFLLLYSPSRLMRLGIELPRLIRQHQIDFAHFQYIVPLVKPCKFIVTTHDLLFNDFPEEFSDWFRISRNVLFRKSLERSDIRLTVSNYSRQAICRHYGLLPETIHLTPNAVNTKFFEPYDKVSAMMKVWQKYELSNYLLYVSRVEPRKNQQLLLQAYEELRLANKGIQLVFVGNNTYGQDELAKAIAQLDGASARHVRWMKQVSDEDLLLLCRGADLFVYPSKAEGFGIPPLEAAAAGIPTLCSNATAMEDYDFFDPYRFDPEDRKALKQCLSQVLRQGPAGETLESIALRIKTTYSWEHSAEVLHRQICRTQELGKVPQPSKAFES
ncbi:MAG: glycosyltransferase family 1 protein [Bacteroidota bacterium]